MYRITDKNLQAVVARINKITGSPATPYSKDADGRNVANIGNYHLSHAYGGVCLHRMHNDAGGVSAPLSSGYVPTRELHNAMQAFISGLEASKL